MDTTIQMLVIQLHAAHYTYKLLKYVLNVMGPLTTFKRHLTILHRMWP